MAHFEIFAVGLIFSVAFNFVACSSDEQSNIVVIDVPDMFEFLKENSGAELTPLELVKNITQTDAGVISHITRVYRIGYRIGGDRFLAQDQASQSWATPQHVTKNLYYPQHGIGAVITYLEVIVNQSTHVGHARVIGGGIGQRHISIVIETTRTYIFFYHAKIYGY